MDNVSKEMSSDRLDDSTINIYEPYLHQEFDNLDDVYNFYNCYALNYGFGIRKSSTSKSRSSGDIIWKKYECDKSGLKIVPVDGALKTKQCRDSRLGCPAKLDVRKNKHDKWIVTGFVKQHNHELDTPRRTKKHRSHNTSHKSATARRLMENLYDGGIGPSNIAKTLNSVTDDILISSQNVIDHLKKYRQNNVGHEGVNVVEYLQSQMYNDPNFYYVLELDTEGVLRSIFWADSRSRNDYITFGDVVVFDVTYKTNKLRMPFAPFTGVNHHRQSLLLGCALLADETEESFVWLFKNWLKCMFNKPPSVIITDMDPAMYNAIRIVFPDTRHRFCSWHINKHLVEHIYAMRDPNSDFSVDYRRWYFSKSTKCSETAWADLLEKYHLENNNWLIKMWDKRIHWVPTFLKDIFVAGMTSTGRSESINSFFDGYVNANTHLIEFVKQYEKALLARRHSEELEDFRTMNTSAPLIGNTYFEAQAGMLYTRSMFTLFQIQFKESIECWHKKVSKINTITNYLVGLQYEEVYKWSNVMYDDSTRTLIGCECALFQTDGYLCKHMLHILTKKQFLQIPEEFVLKRWTILSRNVLQASIPNVESVTPIMKWKLASLCNSLVDKVSLSVSSYNELYSIISNQLNEINLNQREDQETTRNETTSTVMSNDIPQITIRDPITVRTKGRPRIATRISSGLEKSQITSKMRTCGSCGSKGHYATTCPNKAKDKNILEGT